MPTSHCQCGAKYRYSESSIGKRAKCKKCGAVFTLKPEDDDGPIPLTDDSDMRDEIAAAAARARAAAAVDKPVGEPAKAEGVVCPCCKRELARSAKICVDCGIDLKTGRSILTADESNLSEIYMTSEGLIRWLSLVFWVGVYPIASEAFGRCKPYASRAIAVITIVTSLWFLAYEWSGSQRMRTMKNLMLWAGEGDPSPEELFGFYGFTEWGDSEAFFEECDEIAEANPRLSDGEVMLAAHKALPPDKQYQGQYRTSQLITHAFLHGDILHLAGNLIFLLVFGARVNALIGNVMTLIIYPILAVGAGLAQMTSMAAEARTPVVGASGAIMGLAGMYFILFPAHQVHMAAWFRWGLVGGFRLSLKMWSMRGFWVVLFYIAFDVFYTAAGAEDNVARWAHLGGFGIGAGMALVLLLPRLINAHGGDLISVILGKSAWALVGRPNRGDGFLARLP
ncbi:MAG: rhomboid family intramembrane serine protease [Phycisphaerales bacterium]|nr:MAG: rhomboid family intramembrane serine protease [Phycisphaerales bacterium]